MTAQVTSAARARATVSRGCRSTRIGRASPASSLERADSRFPCVRWTVKQFYGLSRTLANRNHLLFFVTTNHFARSFRFLLFLLYFFFICSFVLSFSTRNEVVRSRGPQGPRFSSGRRVLAPSVRPRRPTFAGTSQIDRVPGRAPTAARLIVNRTFEGSELPSCGR